jgi:antitoxin MazE
MSSAHATVKKWGNSIGLVLPAHLAKALDLVSGTRVEILVSEQSLVVRKVAGQSRIEELCAAITPENLHAETEWGSPQGKEVW